MSATPDAQPEPPESPLKACREAREALEQTLRECGYLPDPPRPKLTLVRGGASDDDA